jgi:hypothetical protein
MPDILLLEDYNDIIALAEGTLRIFPRRLWVKRLLDHDDAGALDDLGPG